MFVYESRYAGTNQATSATWVVPDAEAVVRDLKAKGVAFEHYDLPGLTTVDGIVEISGKFDVLIKYRRAATGALAGFDLDAARSYVTGSIAYQNPVENGGIDQERFELTIPKGAKIQTIR